MSSDRPGIGKAPGKFQKRGSEMVAEQGNATAPVVIP
jgi:hypothetical protein